MLKVTGAVLVIFSCAALGYRKSMQLSKRLHQLMEIQKMVILLLGEIAYRRDTLPEVMCRVSEKTGEPLGAFLKEVSDTAGRYPGERFSNIFSAAAETYLRDSGMTQQDLENFFRLGDYLGYMDVSMQKNTAGLYLEELKQEIQQISGEMPAKKKLYQSMGILGGIFLALVFV